MAGVIITADDLDASASNVASLKTQMENTFEQTRSMIRSMNAYWESPAARAAAAQFEQLTPIFPKYIALVNNYITYLKQTAQAYLTEGKRIQRLQVALIRFLFECNPML